jgi:hypothetical protein
MAVVDLYSQTDLEAGNGKKFPSLNGLGTQTFTAVGTAVIVAADDNGSVYRVIPNMPSNAVPINICIHHGTITNGTDYDLGLYKVNSGAVVDKDILADGLDLSTARAISTWNNAGMTSLDIVNGTQTLAALSAQTDPDASYDICLTANAVGSATSEEVRVTFTYALI